MKNSLCESKKTLLKQKIHQNERLILVYLNEKVGVVAMKKLELWSSRHAEKCSTLNELRFFIVLLRLSSSLKLSEQGGVPKIHIKYICVDLLLLCFCFACAVLCIALL